MAIDRSLKSWRRKNPKMHRSYAEKRDRAWKHLEQESPRNSKGR